MRCLKCAQLVLMQNCSMEPNCVRQQITEYIRSNNSVRKMILINTDDI
jgi:hypothetical protein